MTKVENVQTSQEILLVNAVVTLCHKDFQSCTKSSIMVASSTRRGLRINNLGNLELDYIGIFIAVPLTLFSTLVHIANYQEKDPVVSSFQTQFTVEFIYSHHQ